MEDELLEGENRSKRLSARRIHLILFSLSGWIVKKVFKDFKKSKFHSIFFLLESKRIIVQRHDVWRPYKAMLFGYSAATASLPSLGFLGSFLGMWSLFGS